MANCDAWRDFAPRCLSDATWEVAAKTRDAVLAHRPCPWGGQMVKFESKTLGDVNRTVWRSLFVQDAPEDPRNVLVRPEVRAMCQPTEELHLRCIETYAPGHALLQRTNCMFMIRLAQDPWLRLLGRVLFGQGYEQGFYHKLPVTSPHRLYKDWPEAGQSTYIAYEAMLIMSRLPASYSHYRSVFVFRTPEDSLGATWTCPFLPAIADMFHRALDRVINGHTIRDMRRIDANMYLVLSLRSYNRGNPLVPHRDPCAQHVVTVSRGEHLGFASWAHFKPHEKFYMSDYLHCFMKQLGHELKTYDTLDGQKLVPYQCVVVRQEWDKLRASFFQAFNVQKAAYRHANGGTSTPSLSEDVRPHVVSFVSTDFAQPEVVKTVVRKTFLELDETSVCTSESCLKRRNSTGEVMTFFV
eukprot:Skav211130  [mRNA]  locus=scaffold1786:74524:76309:+ [translate_table: standard]